MVYSALVQTKNKNDIEILAQKLAGEKTEGAALANEGDIPEHLRGLNPEQLEAVTHFEGPILVLAGAGSGKTRVLTRRVANLVLRHRVNPWNILAVTFTNKAADEMRERLKLLLGERIENLWVSTFHSAGLRMLRKNAALLGYTPDFTVYDDKDSKNLLKQVLKELGISEKHLALQEVSKSIDYAKNYLIGPEEYPGKALGKSAPNDQDLIRSVYDRYQQLLLKSQAMDFGDLLMNAVLLLRKNPTVQLFYQNLLKFVLVDEFQDTNVAQYEFIRLLVKPPFNLLVVGDDDQSIYAFRGATISNILNFEQDFPECQVVKLEQNYRSTGNILEAAHSVIKQNKGRKDKKLWTSGKPGEPLYMFTASDEMEEANFVVSQIERRREEGFNLTEMAIFYRTNAQSRALEEALMHAKIPYRIVGGQKFYERKEIKDIIAYLRLLVNEADDQSFLRVINTPPRGIGAQSVQAISLTAQNMNRPLLAAARELAESNKHLKAFIALIDRFKEQAESLYLGTLIEAIVDQSSYGPKLAELKDPNALSRLENLKELVAIGRQMENSDEPHGETIKRLLDRVTLTTSDEVEEASDPSDPESSTKRKEAITLMTLHLAKGLEFPVVFLTGLEEGLLPHYHSMYEPKGVEEERRLCYVGITRAMRVLYLTRAYCRGMFGGDFGMAGGYREQSRFCWDLPQEVIEVIEY